jgi:hypothetical protein
MGLFKKRYAVGFRVNYEAPIYTVAGDAGVFTAVLRHKATGVGGYSQTKTYETKVEVLKISKDSADVLVNGMPQKVHVGTKIVIPHTTTFTNELGTVVITKPTTIEVVSITEVK